MKDDDEDDEDNDDVDDCIWGVTLVVIEETVDVSLPISAAATAATATLPVAPTP